VWQPATVIPVGGELAASNRRHSTADVFKGWSPFIVASVLIFVTGLPAAARYLNVDALRMPMPFLHNAVLKMPPVAPQPTPEDATVNLNFIGLPGTVVFVASNGRQGAFRTTANPATRPTAMTRKSGRASTSRSSSRTPPRPPTVTT